MKKLGLFGAVMAMMACGGELVESAGKGSVVVTISGEDAAETGFPVSDDGETIEFVDGWTMTFDKVLVSVGAISLASAEETNRFLAGDFIVDLTGGPVELAKFSDVEARRWERFGFELLPATAAAKRLGTVSEADAQKMVADGLNYWISGTAKNGDRIVTFDLPLRTPTRNADCTNGDDGKQGLVVAASSSAAAEITIHLDHLFWTSLGAEGGELRFEPLAAMADSSGHITLAALADQELAQPTDADGQPILDADGKAISYDPGVVQLTENNLKGFVLASFTSAGHLNGEGLCTVSAR